MKKSVKPTDPASARMVRTTIIIPSTIDLNLDVVRIKLSKGGLVFSKNDIVKIALAEYIAKFGLDPNAVPVV